MRDDFAIFILTHQRPTRVHTYTTLRRQGYTGRIVLLVDDEDPTLPEYRERFGDEVVVFSKAEAAALCDPADLTPGKGTPLYARNASFGIAEAMGLSWFCQYDDDYSYFAHRWLTPQGGSAPMVPVRSMDEALDRLIEFADDTNADCVAMSQGGDHLGGGTGSLPSHLRRKVMNTFLFRVGNPWPFLGRLNDDVNMYVVHGSRGALFLTVMRLQCQQKETQQAEGGLTDMYREAGTYVKSFSTVMMHPSSVTVNIMRSKYGRAHHRIDWRRTVPMIVSDRHRKPRAGVKSPS